MFMTDGEHVQESRRIAVKTFFLTAREKTISKICLRRSTQKNEIYRLAGTDLLTSGLNDWSQFGRSDFDSRSIWGFLFCSFTQVDPGNPRWLRSRPGFCYWGLVVTNLYFHLTRPWFVSEKQGLWSRFSILRNDLKNWKENHSWSLRKIS